MGRSYSVSQGPGRIFRTRGSICTKEPGRRIGKECVVFEPDIPVHVMANVESLNQSDGNLSPGFDHAGKQVGVTSIEGGFEAHRKLDGLLFIGNVERGEMGAGERRQQLVLMQFRQINSKQKKQVGDLDAVDGAQAVQLMNARDGIGILDLGEPSVGDMEFRLAFRFGDLLAEIGDLARRDA